MLEFILELSDESKGNSLTPNSFCRLLPFYAVTVGEYYTNPSYITKRDGLDNFLMIITLEGEGNMSYMGGSCVLEKGSAVVIDCNQYQEYSTGECGSWHFWFVHFSGAAVEAYKSILTRTLTPVNISDIEHITEKMRELYDASFENDTKAYIKISNIISSLLTDIVLSMAKNNEKESSLNRKEINELTAFISKNYEKDLHIEDFTELTRLSKYYLIHIFKKQTGMSPHQYLNMCRVNASQKLLTSTGMSVEEIALKVGYKSSAVFIRQFKAFNKITPHTYRNEALL